MILSPKSCNCFFYIQYLICYIRIEVVSLSIFSFLFTGNPVAIICNSSDAYIVIIIFVDGQQYFSKKKQLWDFCVSALQLYCILQKTYFQCCQVANLPRKQKFFTVGNYLQVVPILTNFWLIIYLFWSSLQIYKRNVFFALLCIVVLTKEHTESYNTRIETYISETYIQGISGHFICLSRLCFRQQLFPLFRVSNKIFGIVFQKRYIYV